MGSTGGGIVSEVGYEILGFKGWLGAEGRVGEIDESR